MAKRRIPEKLAKKLLTIRLFKRMTQAEVLGFVYPEIDQNHRGVISQFEKGRNQPPLIVLQRYAELANIELEKLSDDSQVLPFAVSESALSKERKRGRPQKNEEGIKAKNEVETLTENLSKENQNNRIAAQSENEVDFEEPSEGGLIPTQSDENIFGSQPHLTFNSRLQTAVERILKSEDERVNFSAKLSVPLLEEIDNLFWQQRCSLSYSKRKHLSRNKLIEIMLQIIVDDFQTSTKV